MRVFVPGLALVLVGFPALAAQDDWLPTSYCSSAYVAKWRADKETALKNPPSRPCWMKAKTGPYVCNKDGCIAAHVYFDG